MKGFDRILYLVIGALVASSLAGCGLFRSDSIASVPGPRLAKTIDRLPDLELEPAVAVNASQAEVLAAYRAVYDGEKGGSQQLPSSQQRNQVLGRRLADLELLRAEARDAEGELLTPDSAGSNSNPYADARDLYLHLLTRAEPADQAQILYQLAQAEDLTGDSTQALVYLDRLISDHPDSTHYHEARFRRAEMHFSNARYAQAVEDFTTVTQAGREGKYWLHASYMLGWSQFKQSGLVDAAQQFYTVVDATAESESSSQQELLDDALRVLMLTLEYNGGVATLAQDMRRLQKPDWQYLVYQRLVDEYLAQERYLDGVATWQLFVDENPIDTRAPNAHVGMIEILAAADFPTEIVPKKREFVARYGIRSEFWRVHTADVRAGYSSHLSSYLNELAQSAHAKAQTTSKRLDYAQAAEFYEQIVATFPDASNLGDTLFLLGEVYTEASQSESALGAYRRVVSEFPEHEHANEAGYSIILALEQLAAGALDSDLRAQWEADTLTAQIDFATLFPADPRAPAVQIAAADRLFTQGAYADALTLATALLASDADLAPELTRTALLIVGHGNMELGEFAAAESAYEDYIARIGPDEQVEERLLASVYKQGEQAEATQDIQSALGHYLRIAQIAPSSGLAASAHFDAIAMVETAGDYAGIADLMQNFRRLYPSDERTGQMVVRLAGLLESQENFGAAAQEYLNVARAASNPEQARQADYLAAELFLKDGNKTAGLEQFAFYAKTYPEPADINMAALDAQDGLLVELGRDPHSVWRAKVALHDRIGKRATQRTRFLAAQALFKLTEIQRKEFAEIALTQPLKSALKRKQRALKSTISAYQKVAGYGVAEYVTAATYRIGSMYVDLSAAIMNSQRPTNLNALQLEQYDILLEEQAYPFEEQAIEIHEVNLARMWSGTNDEWVEQSLVALRALVPGRFDKNEVQVAYVQTIH